ncbi:MAG: DUF5658 family protein [Phycisphaerales bacterium]|nr:hypothetical protein [Planctomycetota bacterium]
MLHAPILYPKSYAVFLVLAALDVICTWFVLAMGGRELNAVADMLLQQWDIHGLLMLKVGVVAMVLMIAEFIGRRRPGAGERLMFAAVAMNMFPVAVGAGQIIRFLTAAP